MGAEQGIVSARRMGRVVLPLFWALLYGILLMVFRGASWRAETILAGAVASYLAVSWYVALRPASDGARSWGLALSAFSLLIPWALALYFVFYEGIYRAYLSIVGAHWWGLLLAAIWVLVSYRLVNGVNRLQDDMA